MKAEQLDDLHDLAAESGCVDLVDLEFFEEDRPLHKIKRLREMGVSVIASHHDFEQTPSPEVMKMLLEKMCAGGADIVKLAVMPQNYKDVLNLLDVTAQVQSASTVTERVTLQQTICREGTAVLTDRQNLLLQPGESRTVSFRYCVDSPALWSPENPNLYTSTMQVLEGDGRTGPGRDRLRHPYPEHRCSAWGTHQRADRQAAGCLHPPRQRHSWCSYPARCRGAPHSSTKGSGLQRHPLLPSPGRAGAAGCLRPVRCAGNGRTERRMERAEKSLRLCSVL